MANVLTGQVLYIDTAATIYSTAKPLGTIVWSEMTSGDQLVIKDENSKVIFQAKAGINNHYIRHEFRGMLAGFDVTTIGGGTLLLYPYLGNTGA